MLAQTLPAQDAYHTNLRNQLQTNFGLPANPTWFLPNTESATFSNALTYGATMTTLMPSGLDFTLARALSVQQGNNPWDAAHLYRNTAAIAAGDKCLLVIWLRATAPEGQVTLLAENTTTYAKEAFAVLRPSTEWSQYLVPFEATAAYAANTLQIGIQIAWKAQTIEIGGAAALNYKNTVSYDDLPLQLHNDYYPGSEADAPWRAQAAADIDALRKADVSVAVLDPDGQPLPNALVQVEMRQHDFKFGTAVISNRFGGGNAQDDVYENKLLNLDGKGHGFNEVVFENDLKWPAWEQHWYSSQAEIAAAVQWLHDRDISIRGHNLQWPGWAYSPPDMEQHQDDPNYLLARIRNHVHDILTYPGVGAECADWDVLNEITQNNDYANALAGKPGFTTGREWYADVFQQADSLVPASKLYLNDYVAIERGDNDGGLIDVWKSRIDELLAAGAPVEGIGFQGHFGAFPTGIPRVKEILDDFWQDYGLEAKVTEYDLSELVPPATQAAYMRDILTIAFAHPSMKGFLMWGFWDGAHWEANSPIFEEDWSLKPSGEAFIDQVFNQWWTDTTAQVNANGQTTVRAFKGKYRVYAVCGNAMKYQDFYLQGDTALTFQLLCTSRVREAEALPGLTVTPTLVQDELRVEWDAGELSGSLHWQVSDAAGRLLNQGQAAAANGKFSLPTAAWPPGMYFLSVANGGQRKTMRVVLAR